MIPPNNFALAKHRAWRCFLIDGVHCIVHQGEVVQRGFATPPLPKPGRPPAGYKPPRVPRWIVRKLAQHVDELGALA